MNIKEFRGIKECNKPLTFSEFTVIIGRNNSGKSSILEALSLLPLPQTSYRLPYHQENRIDLLTKLRGGRTSLLYAYSGSAIIKYVVKNRKWKLTLEETLEPKLQISKIEQGHILNDPLNAISVALGKKPGKGSARRVNQMVFYIPNDSLFLEEIAKALQIEKNQNFVTKTGAHARVAKLINECVDDKYSEVLFSPDLRLRKETPNNILYIKIKDLGDGIKKIAVLFMWLEALKPSLILWDDFEGSAHPALLKRVMNWLIKGRKKHGWQIILSTHSIDVLNILLDLKPTGAKVIQTKKTDNDILTHKSLNLEKLEDLFDANQDPRKLVDLLEL